MLVFTEGQVNAAEAEHARGLPLRFHRWWSAHADLLGPRDAFSCRTLIEGLAEEIAFAGLVEEDRRFLYCAARVRMPDMGERQYLLALDAIVAEEGGDRDKLHAIDRIAREVPADAR